MRILKTVLLISITFSCYLNSNGQNSKLIFKNCQEAQKQSVADVKAGKIKYYTSSSSHDKKSERVYQKRDSILENQYGIEIITNNNVDLQYTQICYNRRMIQYFDSAYRKNILLEALVEAEKKVN